MHIPVHTVYAIETRGAATERRRAGRGGETVRERDSSATNDSRSSERSQYCIQRVLPKGTLLL